MKISVLLVCGLLGCWAGALSGQRVDPVTAFQVQLAGMDLLLLMPADAGYQAVAPEKRSDYFPCQFALYSRREKMEHRFWLEPEDSTSYTRGRPQVRVTPLLVHLASNDDDSHITGHELDATHFQADWAMAFFFPPKASFSSAQNCRLLVIYRAGVGLAYTATFFDQPTSLLDQREKLLCFTAKEE